MSRILLAKTDAEPATLDVYHRGQRYHGVGLLSLEITLEQTRRRKPMPKKGSKTQRLTKAAFHELKANPPNLTAKSATQKKKQRVAIGLSKARAAGAHIPRKGARGR